MREVLTITSKDNPVFRNALGLLDKRRRAESGTYLAEGERLVMDLFAYGFSADIVCILTESAIYDRHSTEFSSVKTYCIPPALCRKLSDTENSQGVFAVVRKPAPAPLSCEKVLFLDRVRDPGNLGTIIRTAAAFGWRDVVLRGCADPYAPKTIRSAMGCTLKVNLTELSAADVAAAGYRLVCADMDGVPVERYTCSGKICLIIGNEANGVSDELKQAAADCVSVTMRGVESLNASVSAAILMYELNKEN